MAKPIPNYPNWIGGKASFPSGKFFVNRNPANTAQVLGKYPRSTSVHIDAAVKAAEKAAPAWKALPAPKRAIIFHAILKRLLEEKRPLAEIMTLEMGKTLEETVAEVQEAADTIEFYAGEGRRMTGVTAPSELKDTFCFTLRRPVGVCGLITPWNFPLAVPSWKLFPALILGNTVVWKPAEDSPGTAHALYHICREAGLPDGVLNIVHGVGKEAGKALVEHPGVRLISFTGSTTTGKAVATACAQNLKRYSLEMGGKNAQIVMADANIPLAVDGAVWGGYGTSGQRCTASSRVLVDRKIHKRFVEAFVKQVRALRTGNGMNPHVDLGPLVNERQLRRVLRYIAIGKKEGAKLLCGGKRLKGKVFDSGYYIEPTIFDQVTPDMTIAQEEIFGPVVSILPFSNFDEAVAIANGTRYGLSSSIYSEDIRRNFQAIERLEAGITYVNSPSIGAEVHMPFGGVKETGSGHREAGTAALDIFSEWKTVYIDCSRRLQKAQVD